MHTHGGTAITSVITTRYTTKTKFEFPDTAQQTVFADCYKPEFKFRLF